MRRHVLAGLASALLLLPQSSLAQENEFFAGKTIRFVLAFAPGQAYDIWARLMARHFPKHIPGRPVFVVENMPGAGGITATNWLYSRAPRDGTVWGMVNHNVADQALSKVANVTYDPARLIFLGTPEVTNRACFVVGQSPVKTAHDLFKHQVVVGGTGAGSPVTQSPRLLKNMLGMNVKLVEGYKSPQDVILAMERGELEGVCQTIQSFMGARPGWLESGRARIFISFDREPPAGVDAPTVYDFVKSEDDRKVLRYYSASGELGRPIALPPEVPSDRVNMLRRAFDATMKDPEFVTEVTKSGYLVTPRSGEQLQQIILEEMQTSPETIARTAALTQGD